MKFVKTLLLGALLLMSFSTTSFATPTTGKIDKTNVDISKMTLNDFLSIGPKDYKKMTGQKLGLKNTIKLKMAQKVLKKKIKKHGQEPVDKGIYILLAILGLGFIGIGLATDWSGSEWIIALILALLCWLPGLIYSLVKMDDYYN